MDVAGRRTPAPRPLHCRAVPGPSPLPTRQCQSDGRRPVQRCVFRNSYVFSGLAAAISLRTGRGYLSKIKRPSPLAVARAFSRFRALDIWLVADRSDLRGRAIIRQSIAHWRASDIARRTSRGLHPHYCFLLQSCWDAGCVENQIGASGTNDNIRVIACPPDPSQLHRTP